MSDGNQETTFRRLPLTNEQDREIKHYIYTREHRGAAWETPALRAMLADMLNPPEVVDDDMQTRDGSMATERMTADGAELVDIDRLYSRRRC